MESQMNEESVSEQGSVVGVATEVGKRTKAPPSTGTGNMEASPMYSFNLSFEELSGAGLEEPARPGNPSWMVEKLDFTKLFVCVLY